MEKNIILKSVDNYEDIRLSDVKRLSNGTQFVSVGLLDEKISVSFKFSFQELYYKRLKELDFTEDIEIELINIIFKNNIEFNSKKLFKPSLLFQKCSFLHSFHFNDKIYENKICFRMCDFNGLSAKDSTFEKQFEVYYCENFKPTLFNRATFNQNVVFNKSKFHANVLFTDTMFFKSLIIKRTTFHNCGLDLSQSDIYRNLIFFQTELNNFKTKYIKSSSPEFDNAITEKGVIPYQNKRETFRIIKNQLIQQNNPIAAEKYLKLEKQAFLEEKNIEAIFEDNVIKTFKILLSDYIILKLNKYSNNFKTSWLYGLAFTLIVALIFHLILSISESYRLNEVKNFVSLINLTDFDLLNKGRSNIFYITVFIAKLSLGFGIYQLIQAFRKFK
jgi:hypothetical protein